MSVEAVEKKKFNFGVLLFIHIDVYIRVLVSLLYNDVMEIFNIGTTVCTLAIIMKKKKERENSPDTSITTMRNMSLSH